MFADEIGATLELSPATKMALIATIADCDPSRRRRREAEARMGAVILALRWTGPPSSPRRLARAQADAEACRPNPRRLSCNWELTVYEPSPELYQPWWEPPQSP